MAGHVAMPPPDRSGTEWPCSRYTPLEEWGTRHSSRNTSSKGKLPGASAVRRYLECTRAALDWQARTASAIHPSRCRNLNIETLEKAF